MKKTVLFITFTALSTLSFSQGSGNGNGNNQNYIYQNGNVGIGTTTPSHRLQVSGKMKVDSSLTVQDSLFVQSAARMEGSFEVEGASKFQDVQIDGTLYLTNLQANNNPSDFSILVADGNGAVLKSGPGSLFPVPSDPLGICDLQGGGYLSNPYWISQPNKLYTACPEILVGINTETPRVNFDVRGKTYTNRFFMGSADPLVVNNDLYFHLKVPFEASADKTVFKIENNNRQLFSINNNGLIRSREILIDAEVWADHVFEPSYLLRPLSEVETFIQQNGHLPDVPSEAEVKVDGINVAEMNALLLQKIEELTLYTIELEKRMNEMEQSQNK